MTKPHVDGYKARHVLDDNAALLRSIKVCLGKLRHEHISLTGAVLVAEAMRQIAEVQRNELMIRTGQYEAEEDEGDE